MSNDIAIGPSTILPTGPLQPRKPSYLITLERTNGKTQVIERFISIDKPQSENGFVQVKGIFCDKSEEEIIKTFNAILTDPPQEAILEMMFPYHRIISIRSLVFRTSKTTTK